MIITITSIFIGLFLGKNFSRLKFEKKQATLEERNTILSNSFHEITEDLKNSQLEKEAINRLSQGFNVEYIQIVDGHSLQKISDWSQSDYPVVCAVAFLGDVRLIDNLEL